MKRKLLGFGCALAGVCFLWNPSVAMVDVLPDAVGYLLLFLGITKFADLSDLLFDAKKNLFILIWVSLLNSLATLFVYGFLQRTTESMNGYEEPVWMLLLSFVFSLLDCYFCIPMLQNLSSGFSELTSNELWGKLGKISVLFVLTKNLCSVLPEATSLTSFEYDAENPLFPFDWYAFVGPFRILFFLPALAVGILWLVRALKALSASQNDRACREALTLRFETEILPDTALFQNRRLRTAAILLRLGFVFFGAELLHLPILFSDFLSAVFFCLGLRMLPREKKPDCKQVALFVATFVVAISSSVFGILFDKSHSVTDTLYYPDAYDSYRLVCFLGSFSAVMLFLCVISVLLSLRRLIRASFYVDYGAGTEEMSRAATKRLQKGFLPKQRAAWILCALTCSLKVAEFFLRPAYAWFWWIPLIFFGASFPIFSSHLFEITDSYSSQYQTSHPSLL